MPSAILIVPGRLDTWTGGYGYDRRMVHGLRERGWAVDVREIDGSFPAPTPGARQHAIQLLASLSDGSIVLVDGLAYGALADEVAPHAARLCLVALVHHPLAEETGVAPNDAVQLRESERRALTFARQVIVTSDATARMLADYDVSADRIVVINPGTDPAPVARGSAGDQVELLCVAALIPRKGHAVLYQALASLPADAGSHKRWRLTCVGSLERDRATTQRLRAQLAADGLAPHVTLAGELDAQALDRCYHQADVFVFPTLYEGYGMSVAEALARGLPVIASRTGAIPELVTDDAGIVVPPGDVGALRQALAGVIGDASLRERLAHGARRRRHRLPTWEQSCARMAATLQRVGA